MATPEQREITTLAEQLTTRLMQEAEAKVRLDHLAEKSRGEVEDKQREVMEAANRATVDQIKAGITERAEFVAHYFTELVRNGVDSDEASWMARDEAEFWRECGGG